MQIELWMGSCINFYTKRKLKSIILNYYSYKKKSSYRYPFLLADFLTKHLPCLSERLLQILFKKQMTFIQQCFLTYSCISPFSFSHPRRPRGSQSGREKRRDESSQTQAEKPLGTDSHRTISKRSSECWLLIGRKKCFVLLSPLGEQHLQSPYNNHLISLVFSVRTVNYGPSFFRAWAINRWKKTRIRNSQHGPKKRG